MSLLVDIKKRLGDFSLNIKLETKGGVSGILGASGSGKSITMMCIAGIIKPDTGIITLNGRVLFDSTQNINIKPQKRRVGYLFQSYALFPNMTVKQNILCPLREEKDKTKKEKACREIIEITELNGLEQHLPHQLSGGQRQRTALARILIAGPDLIILDEPFSAVDSHLREQLQTETLKLLKRFGKETILVSHSRDEIYFMCKNLALIDKGEVLCNKETKLLFKDPGSIRAAVLTGCKNIAGAVKISEYKVYVNDWKTELTTAAPVRDNLCAVGIRAHYFNPKQTQNSYNIYITNITEKPFEYYIRFRYENQQEGSKDISCLIPKEPGMELSPERIGADPADIMLLYD